MRHDQAGYPPLSKGRQTRKGRYLLAGVSGLAVVLASAGCSGGSGTQFSTQVVIAAVPGVDNAPLFLAKKDGLFAQAGLTSVVIKNYPSVGAEFTALQNGSADIAASDYGDIFYKESQSPDYKILADGYDATAGVLEVLTYPGSGITNPAQLKDVKVGLPGTEILPVNTANGAPVSLDAAAAQQVLFSYLDNADTTVQWTPMSQQKEVTELQQHKLKAILVGEPYIYQAESEFGATEVLDACSGPTANLPLSGYVSMAAWATRYPAAAADFQAAIVKAQSDGAMAGPVRQVLPSATGMPVADADMATIGTYPTTTSISELERVVLMLTNDTVISLGSGQKWTGDLKPMVFAGS
jgi:NitT/TauT family transport system substrate-binding protein